MPSSHSTERIAPLEMQPEEFRKAGYALIDQIAEFLKSLPLRPVTTADTPKTLRALLEDYTPEKGTDPSTLLAKTAQLLFDHSLFNGHPRFWGYITSSAAPIGALGEMLASSVNPNGGAFPLSPMATEIERQTIRWIAEWIGYPATSAGIFVSGGNMANFVGFLTARKMVNWDSRKEGLRNHQLLTLYCPMGTHTWVQKAADLFGLGTDSIRWIDVNDKQQIKVDDLATRIEGDLKAGHLPFMVVGTAGSVGTGAVDPLAALAVICKKYNLWFHVDGAYGVPAAMLPENQTLFNGLTQADSIALDPHKWLYSPLEAGCVLVRDANALHDAFSFHPEYYKFDGKEDDPVINFHEYGLQNSRGFRALKVWLSMMQVGKGGFVKMIRDDIALAKVMFDLADQTEELEAIFTSLSITVFRYVPADLKKDADASLDYLNKLNETLVERLQEGGEIFLSNAVVDGKYCLRACIVNFRTTLSDVNALPEIVLRIGREVDTELRSVQKKIN
jgi:aromatic-L-amino-acid/L-tryptophan decarboxylase